MRNDRRYLEVLWAAWWAGLVVVPVNAKLHQREVKWIIENSGARWAFVTADVAPTALQELERQVDVKSHVYDALAQPLDDALAEPLSERESDDLAWLFYTSGTTGRPKCVMLSHRNLMTMGLTYYIDVDPVAPDDFMAYGAPMSHGGPASTPLRT
ncbi:MAG: AMP-dependent synthetase [Ramlibacter sp.]|jgi:long-chain acyl-CoA synthetase|uniref:class I adenylate-forming enzyme family protein n=1 Tax=Ramlibacter sp. TaxID=1917967 RepID=UPI002609BCCA|nr:class I adenylate-forming enzyme family protein [Ramlibacter sp.]MDB5751438.1 AMP-dependent synthetase [Ramlibacter sp.]